MVKLVVLAAVIAMLCGCSSAAPRSAARPDLGNAVVAVDARTKRLASGTHVREYGCGGRIMYCNGRGPQMTCRCVSP